MRTKKKRRTKMAFRTLLMVMLMGLLVGIAWISIVYAADDCGPDPCPGTLPAIWPHPSATEEGMIRILGWNLVPMSKYEIVLVRPDGVFMSDGSVTTDIEGDILGRYDGADGQPYICEVQDLGIIGVYQVRVYLSPWNGSLHEVPVAATSFYNNGGG